VIEVVETRTFQEWISRLRDHQARARIAARVLRMTFGNYGDVKPIGQGVSEMRIDYGPGYRVYFTQRGERLILLLCGGDKSSQDRDILKAKALAKEFDSAR